MNLVDSKLAKQKKILIAPLNWGLGHASRCVPVIKELKAMGHFPVIAASPVLRIFLEGELDELSFLDLPEFKVQYGGEKNFFSVLLGQLPSYLKNIKLEHSQLDQLIKAEGIDGIISDSRFGLYSRQVPSALIAHHLSPIASGFAKIFEKRAKKFIKDKVESFDFCWIPDYADRWLSGSLSEMNEELDNLRLVGPLSRMNQAQPFEKDIDLSVIISGPEPQRSQFDRELMAELSGFKNLKIQVLRGLPQAPPMKISGNINVLNHLPFNQMRNMLLRSKLVISRSGYTSIMDLERLGINSAFIPTPGQTEQIYLAKRFQDLGIAPYQEQSKMNLKELVKRSKEFKGFSARPISGKLNQALGEFVNRMY